MAVAFRLASLALLAGLTLLVDLAVGQENGEEPVPACVLLRGKKHEQRAPPLRSLSAATPSTHWISQRLDHFNSTETRTWQQRWFMQTSYYNRNGSAFIYISGESEANSVWLVYGHTAEMARHFGASMFQLEHRYYGQSRPVGNMSTANLYWLSAEQALADLAYFIEYLKTNGYVQQDAKVVVFGGSYAGNLAAWARLQYPSLVFAAVSSSGPVLAKLNFVEFMEVVASSLKAKAGQWCVDNLQKGFRRAQELIQSGTAGIATVKSTFRVCSSLDLTKTLNIQSFFSSVANVFGTAVQYNKPAQGTSSDTINDLCSLFSANGTTLDDDEAMQKLASIVVWSSGLTANQCLDYSYQSTVSYLSEVDFENGNDENRLWTYQTCTEFGYYQTDESADQPFGQNLFPLTYFIQQCIDVYGERYNKLAVGQDVHNTNSLYGGLKIPATRVIYVNGDADPWHALSVLTSENGLSPAIVIPGTSHCYDMQSTNANTDSANLTQARQWIQRTLGTFLSVSEDSGAV